MRGACAVTGNPGAVGAEGCISTAYFLARRLVLAVQKYMLKCSGNGQSKGDLGYLNICLTYL